MLKGRESEAREVMACLDEVPLDHPSIHARVQEIKESLEMAAGVGIKDLFTYGKGEWCANARASTRPHVLTLFSFFPFSFHFSERNFHRTVLGFVIQMFQQISGINLITYYAGTIFEEYIGLDPIPSRILAACNGTEYFIASFIAVYTIEKFGRRKLMLFGAAGMSASMAILAAMNAPSVRVRGDGTDRNGPPIVAAVFLFVFNTFFAIGWLGMTWLYPAEIT